MEGKVINNKTLLKIGVVVALIIILLIAAVTIINLSPRDVTQNSPPIASARIASFTVDTSWNNPVGVTMTITFNVTVCNNGTVDINGGNLTLQRVRSGNESELCFYDYTNENYTIFYHNGEFGVLHSGETRQIIVTAFTGLIVYGQVTSSNYYAILRCNGTVFDERTLR